VRSRNPDPDEHSDGHADSDRNADRYHDGNADTNKYADQHADCYSDRNGHGDPDGNDNSADWAIFRT
jgi:hypothetical protein